MISEGLLKDFVCSNYDLGFLAEKYNLPKAEILSQAYSYACKTKKNYLSNIIKYRYKKHFLKEFLASNKKTLDFIGAYNMSATNFLKFIKEVVEDRQFVPSDNFADAIFRKAIAELYVPVAKFPERIVCIIAQRYVQNKAFTQENIAGMYNIAHGSISNILRRGIAEDIIDDDTAELVYTRVTTAYRICPKNVIRVYEAAFDKRYIAKLKKQLRQMENLMESDENNLDFAKLQENIELLKKKIEAQT